MSAAKMVADSTQAEPDVDGRKRKKKVKKTAGKKVNLPEDDDSDLDLRRNLAPIMEHIASRGAMVEEMFRAVRGPSLQRALPDLLKSIPLEELKVHCLEQLEVMSKKRIRRILAGEDSANISSSGTEDDSSDDEPTLTGSGSAGVKVAMTEAQPADSTVTQEHISKPEEVQPAQTQPSGFTASFAPVEIKKEPMDSAEENEETGEGEDDRDEEDDKEEEDEEDDEEAAENYTSGSEDGELVRREDQGSGPETVDVKQEPESDTEQDKQDTGEEEEGGEMMDQMELLELEMRARAIKAMLSSQDDGDG